MPKLTNKPRKILDTKCAPSTPPKKSTAQKLESQRTKNGGKKEAQRKNERAKQKKHVATTQNLSATKKLGVALLCPLEPSKWTKQSST